MKTPSFSEMLFSAKCFAASMLALYVALAAGLPRPFWAMMTAYIVASPLAGAVRSKAVFRLCGTLIGSAATVLMVPPMANAPELLSLALACWVGLCLYISLLDRTPRSYTFMLAGYTAGLIGFPAVADPAAIFDVALARVEEIGIGILAATVVHSLLLPQGVGPVLLGRLDRALGDAQRWMIAVLQPAAADQSQAAPTRLALAAEIGELRAMSTHLPFDTSQLRWTASMVQGLHDRLTVMVPLLLAVEDRLQALEELDPDSLTPAWRSLLERIAGWVAAGQSADPARAAQLRAELAALAPPLAADASWSAILRLNLIQRLDTLIEACEEGLELRSNVNAVLRGAAASYAPPLLPAAQHRDHGMALRSALAAVLSILLCCAFWIATAWPAGAAAPMMAGVFCCFFATQDDPVPAIKMFIQYTVLSMPVSAFYIIWVLPAVHSYATLVLAIAPVFLLVGLLLPRPATGARAMAFLISMAASLSLQDSGTLDIPSFLNSMLAQLFGFISAGVINRLVRTVSADWMARRMLRSARRELARMAQAPVARPLLETSALMVDRIGLLMPRLTLARSTPEARAAAVEALRELRVGLHIAHLRAMQQQLEQAGVTLQPLLRKLASHFSASPAHAAPSPALLERIDGTLRAVCAAAAGAARPQAAAVLASMRRDLFPRAAPYQALNPSLSRVHHDR